MIDPHVHLRDWTQSHKETVRHGLEVAYRAGLDGVFEMPNTKPTLTSISTIKDRLALADRAIDELGIEMFHGLYGGITADPKQIEEMVRAHEELFPRVVGLKMYAGKSTGNLEIIHEEQQRLVYRTLANLGYTGVLAVHCEKESKMKPELWDRDNPFTHTLARPPDAEVESAKDELLFAQEEEFKGTLHICHISVPESLFYIEHVRDMVGFNATCGLTPHHAMLCDEDMKDGKTLMKINPPLREKWMREHMLEALLTGRIDWVETDHAPHTLSEKEGDNPPSGIPVLPFYPYFIALLNERTAPGMLDYITHDNICNTFRIDIPNTHRRPDPDLAGEYEYDPFESLK